MNDQSKHDPTPTPPAPLAGNALEPARYRLWKLLNDEHGIIALENELDEIIDKAKACPDWQPDAPPTPPASLAEEWMKAAVLEFQRDTYAYEHGGSAGTADAYRYFDQMAVTFVRYAEERNRLISILAKHAPAPIAAGLRDGCGLIQAERQRQVSDEKWDSGHDDEHAEFELTQAAISYARRAFDSDYAQSTWPWPIDQWKPSKDSVRNLVKAGALIASEIDRLQRLTKGSL